MDVQTCLQTYFHKTEFRPNQESIVRAILAGQDVLALLSTGAGKSLCFQLPAVLLPGATIVISPLISLMEDQVAHLRANGISATSLSHQLPPDETNYRLELITIRHFDLIYVSPERLHDQSFVRQLSLINISLVVVDEAHCISEWGHEFRPEYRQIHQFITQLPLRPVVAAFTATATLQVAADIASQLHLDQPKVVRSSIVRENLALSVVPCFKQQEKWLHLIRIVRHHVGQTGIIYATTRDTVERLTEKISLLAQTHHNFKQVAVGCYHAGMADDQRRLAQQRFQAGQLQLLVATTAFGMGVDKADVRYVIHFDHPASLESYFQQVGRGGRDGLLAHGYLLFHDVDASIHRQMIDQLSNQTVRQANNERLQTMVDFCLAKHCRMQLIARYFSEIAPTCARCDHCTQKTLLHPYFQSPLSLTELDTIHTMLQESNLHLTDWQICVNATLGTDANSQHSVTPGCGKGWREQRRIYGR